MAVSDLAGVRAALLQAGEAAWLQSTLTSLSPLGSFLALGAGRRLALLQARYSGQTKEFHLCGGGVVDAGEKEGEEMTSLLCMPVTSGRGGALQHVVVAGFSSGAVRVYSEAGAVLACRAGPGGPVRAIRLQAAPEGKHWTNILASQTVVELLVVYPAALLAVSGSELYQAVTAGVGSAARAAAGGETWQPGGLAGTLLTLETGGAGSVADCASYVVCSTAYSRYSALTMRGGVVDTRHRPVRTAPVFITCGSEPFLQYSERAGPGGGAAQLAGAVVNTVYSGLSRLWGGGGAPDPTAPRPDPSHALVPTHSLKDEGRSGLELVLSPNKMYTAVRDNKNRVMVFCNSTGAVIQAWRGYHRVQLAWTTTHWQEHQDQVLTLYPVLLTVPHCWCSPSWPCFCCCTCPAAGCWRSGAPTSRPR